MKISEVIKKLQEIQKERGDLEVVTCHDPWYNAWIEPISDYHIRLDKDNNLYIGS